MSGILYLCATPIGNLEDITYRVLNTLREVDLIAAEDTRHSLGLLNHFDIKRPLTSYHEYNKYEKAKTLINMLKEGKNIALITDAGTPGISDPGEVLVGLALEEGIEVTALPGATAGVTALSMSGISSRRFVFEGFLPSDKKERRYVLRELIDETRTIILYEAPHHLTGTLEELYNVLGERRIVFVKELTKKHEDRFELMLSEAADYCRRVEPKGEYVLIIEGRKRAEILAEEAESFCEMSVWEHVAFYESQGYDRKQAMKMAAADRGVGKREIYQALLNKKADSVWTEVQEREV